MSERESDGAFPQIGLRPSADQRQAMMSWIGLCIRFEESKLPADHTFFAETVLG